MSSLSPAASASSASNALSNVINGSTLRINGLASGLNTDQIIQGLLAIDQQRIKDIQNRETQASQVQAAFQGIEGRLLAVQNDIASLGKSVNGSFDARTVTASNSSLVSAAADSTAVPGVYSVRINNLATAEQVASQGFDDPNSAITQGTFQIALANGTTTTVTIDSSNSTLQGLANAINNAGAGVTASIINDGSGTSAQPYRLLLTANGTGTANAFTITNQLGASGSAATQPEFNAGYIGQAAPGTNFTGTATPTSNTGAGSYTGTANNTYTFTVISGGTVGTDNNIQIGYRDTSGTHTGTLTLASSDVNIAKAVADGIEVQFGAGTLIVGQTFSIKATVPNVQTATDASVTLGSGAGALTVTSPSNQVANLIPGVTLQLQGADPSQPVAITVSNDTTGAQKAVDTFVSDYNALMQYIDQQDSYDPTTKQAGLLLGDIRASDIQDQLRSVLGTAVAGVNPRMNNLGALGITTDQNGQLVVEDSKLSSVLSGGVPGVTINDVKRLFALTGASTNPAVQFITGGTRTRASATPYTVNITQAAQQAAVTATNPLASQVTIDGTNDTLALTVNGQATTVSLGHGSYSQQGLAQMVQAAINGNSALVGRQVTVALQNAALTITTNTFGASAQVTLGSGSANAALGFTVGQTGQGRDVAGSFIVNGVTEAATGNGQLLTGAAGNANTAGMEVRIGLTPAQVGSGTQVSLTVSRGVASQLDVMLSGMLDPVNGRLKSIDDSFTSLIDGYKQQITSQTTLMQAKQQQLLTEFANMEQTLAKLQSVSSFISAQALALPQTSTQSSSSSQSSSGQ